MNNDTKVRQQIVDKIKNSTNILVTVSRDPSVDALSAALGLTLLLDKLGKHATAVFSGATPPAMSFLNPDKTFESSVDSLRDFIIALNKEKADHLRYKIDGDVVKIFITPYRTTITSEDLEFSQGDYNVELVLALGVESKDHLDTALEAHGKILDDATVATISASEQSSKLGSLDWHDKRASGLSEMSVNISESLKSGDKTLIDEHIATAFLTGIVAATDRFSNTKTSSSVMAQASKLMAAGADQQLIAAKLQETAEIQPEVEMQPEPAADGTVLDEGSSVKIESEEPKQAEEKGGGELVIDHDEKEEIQKDGTLGKTAAEIATEKQKEATMAAEQALTNVETPQEPEPEEQPAPTIQPLRGAVKWTPAQPTDDEPSLGGTLNATTEQAEQDRLKREADTQNKTILSHNYIDSDGASLINSAVDENQEPSKTDIFSQPPQNNNSADQVVDTSSNPSLLPPVVDPGDQIATGPTLADIEAQARSSSPPINLPPPPPLPDFGAMEAASSQASDVSAPATPVASNTQTNDPSQFHIPGQQ